MLARRSLCHLPISIATTTALCCLASTAHAQVDRAALSGIVTDQQQRVLPQARIVAQQQDTGLERSTVSSADGRYSIPELPVGSYTVTISHAGFEAERFSSVPGTSGHTSTLNASLRAASAGVEQVKVSAAVVDEDRTSNTLGAHVERKQIDELPVNGRNWSTLTALVPGAVDTGGSNQRTIRFAGRGLDDNNFTYDGVDATNIVNQAQQPFVRLAIPTDSIQEFHVSTALFTAENGSTPGGQVAVVSGSGTNQLHGGLFDFVRNSALDAREPIDKLNPNKPDFTLNQFGGRLGGPLVQDRTFYFFTYEGLLQSLAQTLPGFVPSDAFRAAVAAASPALAPVLAAYPHGQRAVSANVAEFVGQGTQRDQEDSGMVRLDHRFNVRDTATIRFNFDAALSEIPLAGSGAYLEDRQQIRSRPVNGAMQWLHIFSNSLINEAKFGFNRGNVYTTNLGRTQLPYTVAVSGFTTLNNNQFKLGVGNSFSWIDNLTWVHGAHTLKLGGEVRRIQLNQGNTASGSVSYASAAAFAANQVSSASYAAELPVNGLRKTAVYAFAQDEWRWRSNLTLNLGVRYSFLNRFHEVLGRAIPFDFATCGPQGFCGAGAEFSLPNLLDVDPRVAVAWSPAWLGGQTVIRAGFGLYHGDGQLDDQNLPINNEVARYSLSSKTISGLSFPITPYLANTPGIVSPREQDRRRRDSYVLQWGVSVEQPLSHDLLGTISYVGSKGTDLLTTSYINLIDPATGLRPYSGFGQVEYRGNSNSSSYQAIVLSVQRSFTRGLILQSHWMLAHAIDEGAAGGGDSDFPQNPACQACERASSDFDARQTFSANALYSLPYGSQRSWRGGAAPVRALFGNWDVTTILSARTGLPVNVTIDRSSGSIATGYTINQRPDRVAGVPLYPAAGSSVQHWLNPAAFAIPANGSYGTLGRNAVRGPGLWQSDLGVGRRFPVTEQLQMQFRAEFFNMFNRAQYGLPLADVSSAGNFGQIIAPVNTGPVGTGTPRQIQFLLRATF